MLASRWQQRHTHSQSYLSNFCIFIFFPFFPIHPSVFQLSHLPLQGFSGGGCFWSLSLHRRVSSPSLETRDVHTLFSLFHAHFNMQLYQTESSTLTYCVMETKCSTGSFQLLLDRFLSAKVSAEDRGFRFRQDH